MSPHALFEAHLDVRDLERSITFYRDVVGLEFASASRDGKFRVLLDRRPRPQHAWALVG